MQLNDFTDYGLRVLIYAAVHGERVCSVPEVAQAFDVSQHHLVKVVHTLRRLGYLHTVRGRGGGFRLARAPERIGIGEVIRRMEGRLDLVECFSREANACPLTPACGLKRTLRRAFDAFFAVLDDASLADIVAEPRWVSQVTRLHPETHGIRVRAIS